MDWGHLKSKGMEAVIKYRYVLLVLLAGLLIMSLPEGKNEEQAVVQQEEVKTPELQTSLSQILSKVSGAGKVEVLLTEAEGTQTIYQTDEDRTSGDTTTDIHRETVLVTNGSREETGLIRRIDPPTYQGAIILCQGADNAVVKLAVVEAVANATGLSTDKITVLKMK